MKAIISVTIILICSISFLNCNEDAKIKKLQEEINTNKQLLAEYQSIADTTRLIAFFSKTKESQKLKIVYYFKSGAIIEEVVDFKKLDDKYRLQTFLTDCDGEKHEKIEFFAMENLDGSNDSIIPVDGRSHPFSIQQPGTSPSAPKPIINFTIFFEKKICPSQDSFGNKVAKAVYTVEMN
ncbi:MAG: hypothetical protein ABIY50_00090 [Ignavibacteria bacterium]